MAKQQRERAVRERRERKAERKREQAHLKLAGTSDEHSPETTDDDTEPGLRLVASGEDAEQGPATASSVDSAAAAENTVEDEQNPVPGEVSMRGVSAPDA